MTMNLEMEQVFIHEMEILEELMQIKLKLEWLVLIYLYPVPMAFHSFGGWKRSLFGDQHMHGPRRS